MRSSRGVRSTSTRFRAARESARHRSAARRCFAGHGRTFAIELLRGNVPTRVAKGRCRGGRCGTSGRSGAEAARHGIAYQRVMPLETFPPACGQGTIAIECRENDSACAMPCRDRPSGDLGRACLRAGFLAALDGSCKTPVAGYARIEDGVFRFDGVILSEDGRESYEASAFGRCRRRGRDRRGGGSRCSSVRASRFPETTWNWLTRAPAPQFSSVGNFSHRSRVSTRWLRVLE